MFSEKCAKIYGVEASVKNRWKWKNWSWDRATGHVFTGFVVKYRLV